MSNRERSWYDRWPGIFLGIGTCFLLGLVKTDLVGRYYWSENQALDRFCSGLLVAVTIVMVYLTCRYVFWPPKKEP